MLSPLRLGLVQLSSQRDRKRNRQEVERWIRLAHREGAEFILTPEMTMQIESSPEEMWHACYFEEKDPDLLHFSEIAKELHIWLLVGSMAIRCPQHAKKMRNRSFLFGTDGSIVARYDKIHLFDVDLPDGQRIRESEGYHPGECPVVVMLPWGKLGTSICYDLRFPWLYQSLARQGAIFLSVPAAFTAVTGPAHWETLLRARAIETGSFILAPAQVGAHDCGRQTYGHSMVVGPWGEVLAQRHDPTPGVVLATITPAYAYQCRDRIPVLRAKNREYSAPFHET